MNDMLPTTNPQQRTTALPAPKTAVTIRDATMNDVDFIDGLQKKHTKQVGWHPRATIEGKIRLGQVIVAESAGSGQPAAGGEENAGDVSSSLSLPPAAGRLLSAPLGYCMGVDRYFKRDDVGIIYQMNVVPGVQRGFIGANLLKAMFDRSAYGCKLFCCWCAQDIEANKFWEAMGFVPLAFRTGSPTRGKKGSARTHIFWQKRIREGDTTTPWWYPCQTTGGSLRGERLVFPIPPGTHWSEAQPVILPGVAEIVNALPVPEASPRKKRVAKKEEVVALPPPKVKTTAAIGLGRLQGFGALPVAPASPVPPDAALTVATKPEKRPAARHDPKHVAFARELRDRYLERYNDADDAATAALAGAKYEVTRRVTDSRQQRTAADASSNTPPRLLSAA